MAQTVENKLTENEERNDKHEQVLDTLYTDMQEIIQELLLNREATTKTNKELVPMGQKLKGLQENATNEVAKSVNALIQNYTDQMAKKEPIVRANLPKMPYLGGTKVEYPIGSSNGLTPRLDPGGDNRKLGIKGRTEPKTPLKQDQTREMDNFHIATEKENIENYQETEGTQKPGKQPNGAKKIGVGIQIIITGAGCRTGAKIRDRRYRWEEWLFF